MDQFKTPEWTTVGKIGGGRFSDIYKITKKDNPDKYYALKIVDPDDVRPPHNIRNEIRILENLKETYKTNPNDNVILLESVLFNNMEYGLIFPYYDSTLNNVIKNNIKKQSKFNHDGTVTQIKKNIMPISYLKSLTIGILNGLDWLHNQGIIHRDINPNNILINDKQGPIIIDFSISYKIPNNNGLETDNRKFTDIATGYYKAPELLLSKRDYNEKVDIWSLGIILILLSSENGSHIFDIDSMHSDLVLLSNILSTFGSPPENWSDCKGLDSFESMNNTFFSKSPKPWSEIVPRLYFEDSDDSLKLRKVFQGLVEYETSFRLSAADALNILC